MASSALAELVRWSSSRFITAWCRLWSADGVGVVVLDDGGAAGCGPLTTAEKDVGGGIGAVWA